MIWSAASNNRRDGVKRFIDVAVSLVAIVVSAPFLLGIGLVVAVDSGLPVLFRQTRVGRGGRQFGMLKFRSMVKDAEALGPHFTGSGDPRVTRVGRILRRTSLDELPQFVNVLRGDMSLVGPRPDVPAQQGLYSEAEWRLRCSVRPGITGLSQALYRSESTETQRLSADLRYIREQSLSLDLKIMWWTLRRLGGRGAN